MRVAYHNIIDDVEATALSCLTVLATHPLVNVQDQRLSKACITDGASTQSILIDFTTTSLGVVTTAAIMGHDLPSGQTCLVQGNDANTWGAPSVSEALTVTASTFTILKFFASSAHRYWRFHFTSCASALTIGRLWLGGYETIDPSSLLSFRVTKKRSDVVTHGTGRQKFASRGSTWRRFELSFPDTQYSMIKKIEDMYDYVGNHSSLIFCNFDTARDYQIVEPCYCSIEGEMEFTHSRNMKFTYSLKLEEEK